MIELENNLTNVLSGELLLFRTIWNNTSDHMFIVRLDEDGDFVNEACNHSLEKTFCMQENEAYNIKLKDILGEESYRLIEKNYNQCISKNKPVTYNESAVIHNEKRYFNTTILPVKDENGIIKIFGISREYTELIKKEQEKLLIVEEKNAQMVDMIENIAHQWRQPLSVISMAASGIKIQKEMGLLEDTIQTELLDNIIENTQYLSTTIDTIKTNITEKKDYREVVIQERINIALNTLKASLENNNIELIENIDEIKPIKIKIIRGKLSEAIINLINNSRDIFLVNNIENPFIKVTLEKKEATVLISIEDNGGGIKEDIMDKIFDLYFTTKHKSLGTGLGLYLVKQTVNNLGGTITATNKALENNTKGAVFTIEIPL